MKKLAFVFVLMFVMSAILSACGTKNEIADDPSTSGDSDTRVSQNSMTDSETYSVSDSITDGVSDSMTDIISDSISKEMAYDGVNNYCHSVYDWSIAEDDPDIMYLKMGEETESEYQVIFRSYTGAFVYFYVDKLSGITRLIEYVPNLEIEEEAGTINLYDYLESDEK